MPQERSERASALRAIFSIAICWPKFSNTIGSRELCVSEWVAKRRDSREGRSDDDAIYSGFDDTGKEEEEEEGEEEEEEEEEEESEESEEGEEEERKTRSAFCSFLLVVLEGEWGGGEELPTTNDESEEEMEKEEEEGRKSEKAGGEILAEVGGGEKDGAGDGGRATWDGSPDPPKVTVVLASVRRVEEERMGVEAGVR